MNKQEILARVKKLLAFNESNATPNEVANATSLARKLLDKYQLSMSDIETGVDGVEESGIPYGERVLRWKHILLHVLAKGNDCECINDRSKKRLTVIGRKSDVEFTLQLYHSLTNLLTRMAKRDAARAGMYGHATRKFTNNYILGASSTIGERLTALRKEPESDMRALVVVKGAAIKAHIAQKYTRLCKSQPTRISSREGYHAGVEAGKTVPLQRGIT